MTKSSGHVPSDPLVISQRMQYTLFMLTLLFFLVSGACGLLYQVVWTRKLVLLFGTTSYAVSTVLSIFFLGLGVGSVLGGRLADHRPRPLWRYGVFEIIIGLWAFVFILTVTYGEGVVVEILRLFEFNRSIGVLLRAVMALILLFVPVVLMGATLPLLARFVNREVRVQGMRIGTLYAMNTFGAVVGCFVTGFILLAQFGYTRTTLIGAAANILVGILAILLSKRCESATEMEPPIPMTVTEGKAKVAVAETPLLDQRRVLLVIAAFALSGFCGLALEVLWTRLLAILFLGTTYAYTTMLTTLLCGLALGSIFAALLSDRVRNPMALLGGVLMLCGVGCVLMMGWLAGMPEHIPSVVRGAMTNWNRVVVQTFLLCFAILIVPTFFLGMTFPLVVKAVSAGRAHLGRDIGRIYFANTIGGVLGAISGGFLIIPLLGTHNGILLLAMALLLMGVVLVMHAPKLPASSRVTLALGGVLLMALSWQRAPQDISQALNDGYIPADHQVIHYREGVEGTVAVSEPVDAVAGEDRVLWINRVQATTSIERGVRMNRLQGILPLLFDRDPQEVLFMCFGSGITAGTLALTDFERIDAVEISPDVLEAASYFEKDNLGVMDAPNVAFHVDDGRNFLLTTRNKYDVITFEPMPLALAGVSTFYTRDYYELCLRRLKPGGMVSQWVPLHSMSPEVVQSLVATFTAVFPEYNAWFVNADLFLIGSNAPLQIDYDVLHGHFQREGMQEVLADAGFPDPEEVIASFLMDHDALTAFTEGAPIMTDDRPWAEFIAPRLVYARKVPESIDMLKPYMTESLTPLRREGLDPAIVARLERRHTSRLHDMVGLRAYYGGMSVDFEIGGHFKASLDIDPENWNAQYYLREITLAQAVVLSHWEQQEDALALIDDALDYLPGDSALTALSQRIATSP